MFLVAFHLFVDTFFCVLLAWGFFTGAFGSFLDLVEVVPFLVDVGMLW